MWDDAKALNALAATLTLMATCALVAAAVLWLARQPAFAIREVVVTTPTIRASAPHLEAVIREELSGTFFTMNLDRARAAIGRVPWVRTVALRRQWPRRLEVAVEEHEPLARWTEGSLVNRQGEVFAAAYDDELPQFVGPEGRAGEMRGRYAEWSAMLAPLGLSLAELRLSARGGWSLRANGGGGPLAVELGRDEPDARLSRFGAAYASTIGTLARAGTRVEHVDLRYRNGFAVRVPAFREKGVRKPA
jgi:cell division protein FtsQ